MSNDVVARIQANPKYQELRHKRSSFGWWLTLMMMVVYYGYISLIAWNKEFLSRPLFSDGSVTTIGVPIGMGVIIFTIVITGIYVRRANGEFDSLTRQILEDAAK